MTNFFRQNALLAQEISPNTAVMLIFIQEIDAEPPESRINFPSLELDALTSKKR